VATKVQAGMAQNPPGRRAHRLQGERQSLGSTGGGRDEGRMCEPVSQPLFEQARLKPGASLGGLTWRLSVQANPIAERSTIVVNRLSRLP